MSTIIQFPPGVPFVDIAANFKLTPSANYTTVNQVVAVPVGAIDCGAFIDGTGLTSPTLRIDCKQELSLDGGSSWIPMGEITIMIPVIPDTSYGIVAEGIPQPDNPNRVVRAKIRTNETVTISRVTLRAW